MKYTHLSRQIDFNRKSEESWSDLLPKIQSVAISSVDNHGSGSSSNPFGADQGGYEDFASASRNGQQQQYRSNFQDQDDDDEGMVGV